MSPSAETPRRPLVIEEIGVDDPRIIPDLEFDEDVEEELWTDDSGEDYSGWICVRTNPFPCPAEGCEFVAHFLTAAHLIIVWPESDDPSLLRHAAAARDVGRNPKPTEYEPSFGPACSYYLWEAAGNPVHAVGADTSKGGVYKGRPSGPA
jgi:hypothetical protein